MSEIREALTAAMDEQETETVEPVAEVVAPEVKPETPVEKPAAARGPDGKFAPKAVEPAAPVEAKPEAPKPTTEKVAPEADAPPNTWRPAIREKWATLPPDVREEIVRREREASVTLSKSAAARQLAEQFTRTIAPYRAAFTGEPVAIVGNLLQTAHALNTGTPQSRAAIVAEIVKGYKVDVQALDAALAGQPVAERQQQEFRDPRLDQYIAQAKQREQQEARRAQLENERKVAEFTAQNEFVNDLRDDMADILELDARKRGAAAAQAEARGEPIPPWALVEMTLEQAYARASKMHPEISGVIAQREAAKAAATRDGATQRARNASSSVRNEAAPAVAAQPDDLRSSIIAAMTKASGR